MASIEWTGLAASPRGRVSSGIRAAWVAGTLLLSAVPLTGQEPEPPAGLVIRRLDFTGNRAFPSDILAAALSTTSSSFFATAGVVRWLGLGEKRRLNEREFRRDVLRLRLFYQIHGYLEAQVDTTVVRTPEDAYLTFHITEGPPTRVRTLEIRGLDGLAERGALLEDLPLRVGEPYDRTLLLATADTIALRLQDRGYAHARVLLDRREVVRAARAADLSIIVEPGPRSTIGRIRVEGARRLDSGFVRSLLATEPGRLFRLRDLTTSQRNLYRSELFRYAAVAADTGGSAADSAAVPLVVSVTEGTFYRARAAVGFGTDDCFRTGVGWTARNALGRGQIFDASAQLSKIGVGRPFGAEFLRNSICSRVADDVVGSSEANYAVAASFRRPVFLSPSNALGVSLFAERRSEVDVYAREEYGGSVTLTRETASRIPVSLTYRLAYGNTEANAASFCAFFNACTEGDIAQLRERRLLATVTLGVQRVRVNNPLEPIRGTVASFEATHSSEVVGSSRFARFTRLAVEGTAYRPFGRLVLVGHLRAGVILAPQLALSGDAGNFVPPEQRFYAGGANDVRGYNRNELGPVVYVIEVDATTEPIYQDPATPVPSGEVRFVPTGANTLLVGNLELRLPSPVLPDRVRFGLFVDAGAVWDRGGDQPVGAQFRFTPGVGVRYGTPLGPARLDLAYNPYARGVGRLYGLRAESGDLVLLRDRFQPGGDQAGRWVIQISVGHAF